MEDQHRKIKGYRELSQEEIDSMNKIKSLGPKIEEVINSMKVERGYEVDSTPDPRWVAIGATHLQEGLMALTRAVAKPSIF